MADQDKTKDYHRKQDFMNPYDEYNSEVTHRFDIATKQWLTNGDFYQNKVAECLMKADIQCDDTLIAEIESSLYFRFISWEYMYEEIDEYIEILKADKTHKQTPQM